MADGRGFRAAGEPISKLDLEDARLLRRKLLDNNGKYKAEVVGKIRTTHRYRGKCSSNSLKDNAESIFRDRRLSTVNRELSVPKIFY